MAALTNPAVVVGAAWGYPAVVMALDGAVDVAATREVDVIVTNNGETAPGTVREGGGSTSSEGEPKSAKKTLSTDSKDPTTHIDQLEHQTGNDGVSRTWKWTSEHLDEGGKNALWLFVW
ncbi:hypothetical protein RvY_07581 [Ramazzottius varieornatus]|uniref:Uncharacterized protein n=1 Tax=Ramazzottius varieornatus TaxID=947166 RepID=A0A1D1V5B0_RAMVA|nr:hypothetical protein RvY_07581 [Ramazzottius varieornatus]